jgi:N-formylmaleamate deformylase
MQKLKKHFSITPQTLFIKKVAALCLGFLLTLAIAQAQTQAPAPFTVNVSGKGQPVIFIPGLVCSGEVWEETVAKFKETHQCHVITLAGYAGTAPLQNGPYLQTYKEGIQNYIKTNKLKKVILVGHSLGGFLSQWIASDMGANIDRLVLVDALPFFAGAGNPNAKEGFNEERATMYYNSMASIGKENLKNNKLSILKGMISDSAYQQKALAWSVSSDLKTEAWTAMEMMGIDLREKIADINCPVLVMAAYAGPVPQYPEFTREKQLEVYQDQYKKVKQLSVVSPSLSKHFIMYDQPEWFYKQLEQFFAKDAKL